MARLRAAVSRLPVTLDRRRWQGTSRSCGSRAYDPVNLEPGEIATAAGAAPGPKYKAALRRRVIGARTAGLRSRGAEVSDIDSQAHAAAHRAGRGE